MIYPIMIYVKKCNRLYRGGNSMGRKIFVSYKYWDSDIYEVPRITIGAPKVRDYYIDQAYKAQKNTPQYLLTKSV